MKIFTFLLFLGITVLGQRPITNGIADDVSYKALASFTTLNDGFGSAKLGVVKYHYDQNNIHIAITCEMSGTDGVVLFIDASGYNGIDANTALPAATQSPFNGIAGTKLDMEADFALFFNEGNGASNLFVDGIRYGASSVFSQGYLGNSSQAGDSSALNASAWGVNENIIYLAYLNDFGSNSSHGIELRIPLSAMPGVTVEQQISFFVGITSNTGYWSNELLPDYGLVGGEALGNFGFDPDLYTASGVNNLYTSNEPLPVELTSFNAAIRNGLVDLKWETATEVNNYGFEVERKTASADWSKIGFVEGHGSTNSPKYYSYSDKPVGTGKIAYRLKQIDNDGQFEYSPEVEVLVDNLPNGFVLEQNYPNPFNPETSIRFALKEDTKATLKVYNSLGAEIATLFDGTAEAGRYYDVKFGGSELASGFYIYKLVAGEYVSVKKMLLMK